MGKEWGIARKRPTPNQSRKPQRLTALGLSFIQPAGFEPAAS